MRRFSAHESCFAHLVTQWIIRVAAAASPRPVRRNSRVRRNLACAAGTRAGGPAQGCVRLNNRINPCYRPRNELTCSEVCADLRDDPLNSCVVVVVCLVLVASAAIAIYWIVQAIK